jgi:hypothetical protein
MQRFISDQKVFAQVHGGCFLWESYRLVLSLGENGDVTYEKEPFGRNPSSPLKLTGRVIGSDRNSWMEIHLFRESQTKKLVIYALRADDQLICSIYSEFNESESSELFYAEGGLRHA